MKAKEVLLLILIIVAGVSLYYLEDLRVKIDNWDLEFPFSGNSYLFEEHLIEPPAEILEINNSHGNIEIEGTDTPEIAITFEKKVWRQNEQLARETANELKLLSTRERNRLILTTNRDTFRKKNFSTSFRIKVPREIRVMVQNSFGTVKISKVKAAELNNKQGKVEIMEIAGPLQATNSYEKLSVLDVQGNCQIETKHSSALLSRIEGEVRINCAYENLELFDLKSSLHLNSRHTRIKAIKIAGPSEIYGTYEQIILSESGPAIIKGQHSPLEIDTVKGPLEVETTYEKIRLERIEGNVKIKAKSSRVELNGIKAEEIRIETSYEPVILENFSGQLELSLKHGDISLTPTSLDFPMVVSTEYGNIKFYWPKNQTARFEARSKGGEISWKLPFPPEENVTNGTALVKAFSTATDRPEVRLSTSYGDIRIMKNE